MRKTLLFFGACLPAALFAMPALAQDDDAASGAAQPSAHSDAGGVGDIVVTARRRDERLNDISVSITALSADTLTQAGVSNPAELIKFVPGLTYSETGRGTPTFYIRGIGFDEATLGANPSVALYTDEVPMAFPVEARFAALDVERVEVLKGPQGLLYGQNSTGGAINFIAAKPTDSFEAGVDASYGRFNELDVRGFVSGPLSDTVKARVAVMGVQADGWQKSYTRDDTLGDKRQLAGRALLDWTPSDRFTANFAFQAWRDRSETLAGQFIGVNYLVPTGATPGISNYPVAPANARAADWDPGKDYRRKDRFFQASLRMNYDLTDEISLTSISALTRFRQNFLIDVDGTALEDPSITQTGRINSFSQELRLSGETGSLKWIVGGNYSRDKSFDDNFFIFRDGSVPLGLGYASGRAFSDQKARSLAAFVNLDWDVSSTIALHGGIRYTSDHRRSEACTLDTDGNLAALFSGVSSALTGTTVTIAPGGCITLNEQNLPSLISQRLNEDNLSWRVGVDFKPNSDLLLYANVSKGYKSGAFPNINTASYIQLQPVVQESVLAYEIGLKATLADRRVQLNTAAFYYDYTDKQLRGRILDPVGVFGALDSLVTIPESRIWGVEADVQVRPATGITLSANATYVNSKVQGGFQGYDPFGNLVSFDGLSFPHTPRWSAAARADFEERVNDRLKLFAGTSVAYQSRTQGLFNQPAVVAAQVGDPINPGRRFAADAFDVKAFTTVDAQLGLAEIDDKWRVWLFGKNIFNTYHWTNLAVGLDTVYRLPAMPVTYGIATSFRF